MSVTNKGYDPEVISDYNLSIKKSGKNFLLARTGENSSEYKHFFFVGMYEGRKVIYDAALYTLRLHHNSELYEIAEHRAAKHFPEFKRINYREDENGDLQVLDNLEEEIGLYMAEVIMELEEEGEVKVCEFLDLDTNLDFGVGLDAALNVDEIDEKVVNRFVQQFNEDSLSLDDTYYTFQTEDEEFVD